MYLAYVYLFSFNYLFKLYEINEISKFKYECYKNFSEILKSLGNPEKVKENYENYAKKIVEGNADKRNVKTFIHHLKKGKLTKKSSLR